MKAEHLCACPVRVITLIQVVQLLICSFPVSLISNRSEAKKTKVKRKTNNPQYDEVFYFEVGKKTHKTTQMSFTIL